jgi:hypothetical protein
MKNRTKKKLISEFPFQKLTALTLKLYSFLTCLLSICPCLWKVRKALTKATGLCLSAYLIYEIRCIIDTSNHSLASELRKTL